MSCESVMKVHLKASGAKARFRGKTHPLVQTRAMRRKCSRSQTLESGLFDRHIAERGLFDQHAGVLTVVDLRSRRRGPAWSRSGRLESLLFDKARPSSEVVCVRKSCTNLNL